MSTTGFLYFMTNYTATVLYVGVTSELVKRVHEHKSKFIDAFTKRYNCTKLVYYETYASIEEAIAREKQIKAGSRAKKNALVESINPEWKDLYQEIL